MARRHSGDPDYNRRRISGGETATPGTASLSTLLNLSATGLVTANGTASLSLSLSLTATGTISTELITKPVIVHVRRRVK